MHLRLERHGVTMPFDTRKIASFEILGEVCCGVLDAVCTIRG